MLRTSLRACLACACLSTLACSSSSSGPSGAAQAVIGPIPVDANAEKTVCITKDLGNTEDLVISGYSATLVPGSHHLILYASNEKENLTPTPCAPFVGLAEGNVVPLVLVNKLNVTWTFPTGIGVEVPAHQMVRIEAHYINTSAQAIQGVGTVTFQGTPKASAPPFTPASFFFWGTENINLPPAAQTTVGPNFQAGKAGTHVISILTHQHELGTGVQVWESARPGDMSNRIVNDLDWSNPSWNLLTPQFDMNGTNGLSYQCEWNNTTSATVHFGESALDEMCFIGGYYYPANGFDLRIEGANGPDAGTD